MSNVTMTTREAAEKLGVSVGRIRQLVLSGDLPSEKFGRDLMIKSSDLERVTVYGKAGRPRKQDEGVTAAGKGTAKTKLAKKRMAKKGKS
jgi:excisionase family DNA binding protein